ncbi:MAG: GGDEF domain-containing protein [Anaerolineales bacterium]|nr:GGDEF domain-containing protein [Anaerolineales bacterium]
MNIAAWLEKQNKPLLVFLGMILICIIGVADYLSGSEFAFSVFYVLPIAMITWGTNRRWGLVSSLISAFVWLAAESVTGQTYSSPLVPIWNSFIRLAFFAIITVLLSSLKNSMELTRTDQLTTSINARYFYEILQMEIDRFQRSQRPFTIAYIDIDNFKSVNDRFGHPAGDQLLIQFANSIRKNIRKSDFIARLGGDEFALLFPETDQKSARIVFSKIQGILREEMQHKKWPVTFSVGIVTCKTAPKTTDQLIKLADVLMYAAKNDGRNTVKYSEYDGMDDL